MKVNHGFKFHIPFDLLKNLDVAFFGTWENTVCYVINKTCPTYTCSASTLDVD